MTSQEDEAGRGDQEGDSAREQNACDDNHQQVERDEITLLQARGIDQQRNHQHIAGNLQSAVPPRAGNPAQENEVKNSERYPEDEKRKKETNGAQIPDRRSSLAAVRREFGRQSFLSSSFHLLDNARNSSPHSPALGSRRAVARRAAGCRRCADDFVAGLFHGPARELFHLALPAGDYRRKHFVLSQNRLLDHRGLLHPPCWHDLSFLHRENSSHLLEPTNSREPTHLAGHQPSRFSGRHLSGQSARPVTSQQRAGAGGEARRASQPAGFHGRHHSLDAWRTHHHGPRRPYLAAKSHRRGNSRTPLLRSARQETAGFERGFLAARPVRQRGKALASKRDRLPHTRWRAALSGNQYFSSAHSRRDPQRLCLQLSGPDRVAPAGAGSSDQGTHGCLGPPLRRYRP